MKRFAMIAVVLAACAAGFVGGYLHDVLNPEPEAVHAQANPRAKEGIRIAIVNLEEVSRQSKLFKALKIEWETAQEDLKKQNAKLERDYETKLAEIKQARLIDDETKLLTLRVEAQSIQEAMKVAQEEQKAYLGSLLAHYQKEVLKEVMEKMAEYVSKQGYDIVLQDYDVNPGDADYFAGGAYASSLMSKPVLLAPGVEANKNLYVTDITKAMIAIVGGG